MHSRRQFAVAALSGAGFALCLPSQTQSAPAALFDPTLPARLCDALIAVFGAHPSFRLAHAKGIVCEGTFTPTVGARTISSAEHFARTVPLTVRFSDFAGTPSVPSGDAAASPHGMGIKFHLSDKDTDIVGHSANAFPGANGEEFLAFLEALAKTNVSTRKPSPIEQYVSAHPAAQHFVQAIPNPPLSYATSAYFMLNAFRFTNVDGVRKSGRYRVMPNDGVIALKPSEIKKQAPDYLREELERRLKLGPGKFTLELQIAQPGDPTSDNTKAWPADRQVVTLGTISVDQVVSNTLLEERALLFDPTRLTNGIELSDDPMPALRSAAYAISMARRSQGMRTK